VATKKTTSRPAAAKQSSDGAAARKGRRPVDDEDDATAPTAETHGPQECLPCRGVGTVISNLGGEPSTVTCPWCQGGGVRLPAMDAQAQWRTGEDAADGADPTPRAAA
jgi:hypothetical protein